MRSSRGLVTFAIACILHAAVVAAVRISKERVPAPVAATEQPPADTEVDFTTEPPGPPSEPATPEHTEPTPVPAFAVARAAPSVPNGPSAAIGSADRGPGLEPSAQPTDPGWHVDLFGIPHGDARGSIEQARGAPRALPGAAKEALGAPPPASTTFGLHEGLTKHDLDVGITRGGFVRSAVEAAVHSDAAPASGTARYDVRVLRDGTAIVSLESASASYEGFAALSGTIKKHIDPKRLRLPDGSRGLHVVIDVDIHDQYPDGKKPSEVGKVSGYIGPGEYDITKDGFIVKKMPGASVGFTGKVCSGAVYIGPAGLGLNGGCSFVNAGVPARRMGSAKVVSEALL